MNADKKPPLNLESVKEASTWDSLAVLNKETIENINGQLALVLELRSVHKDRVVGDIELAFTGLELSFKDLIRETVALGCEHASKTTTITASDDEIEIATEFSSGDIENDDQALNYVNIGSRYLNIQDRTVSLISQGWVDLFAKLRIPTGALLEEITKGTAAIKGATNATTH